MSNRNKAIFIDKDGTLIPDIPYNVNPDLINIDDEVIQGLQLLKEQGYLLVVISNQSGVARGYFGVDALKDIEKKISSLLAQYKIKIAAFYFCPHHPEGNVEEYTIECDCRKPKPGMILKACEQHSVDATKSWMIGDILNDVEAGNRAGCKTVLVDNGNETEWESGEYRTPTYLAMTFLKAAQFIVEHTKEAVEAA
jgi:D-glycero-D-manno-heptose 1,7-bisphosphate phosphatase